MPGTKAGGLKAAKTNLERHGRDFYSKIGQEGGRKGHTGGFAANPELARAAGAKGGRISRRPPDDKPTAAQITTIYRWISWYFPVEEARDAVHWLRDNASRADVIKEVRRIKVLYDHHSITKESVFSAPVWREYNHE